jgi:hypothetical protein
VHVRVAPAWYDEATAHVDELRVRCVAPQLARAADGGDATLTDEDRFRGASIASVDPAAV